ncbi:MAG: hypothetical protein QG657_4117 [Acidobacteriota bacterium]|nr:hypothetical protein [Acidobacteriota bacterium]
MGSWTRKRMETLLKNARRAITNALAYLDIKEKIQRFGYDETKLLAGHALYKKAQSLYIARKTKWGLQLAATKDLIDLIDAVFVYYMEYAKLVRKRLKRNKEALTILGMNGRRALSLSGLITQATLFFQNLKDNQDLFNQVSDLGISQQVLQVGLDKLAALENEDEFHESVKGEAQDLTVERNKVFTELNDWMAEFETASRSALKDTPQRLEILGFIEYSEGYKPASSSKDDENTNTNPS